MRLPLPTRVCLVSSLLLALPLASVLPAQRTTKPGLHGTHWVAVAGKPLAATAGAIANVCIVADVHARQIPAKLFEQITAGRPLVLLTPLPSDAADLLQGVSDAVILRHGDEAGLDNALARLASATRRQPRAVAGAVPAHLTVTATMDALETLLRGAIGAKRIHATTQRQS